MTCGPGEGYIHSGVALITVDSRIQQVSLRFSRANMVRGCAINIKQGMHPVPRSREAFLSSRRVAVTRCPSLTTQHAPPPVCGGTLSCAALRRGEVRA